MASRITQRIAGSLARELKELPEKLEQEQLTQAVQRLFHLDGSSPDGRAHQSFAFFTGEPDYDRVKAAVLEILHGTRNPRSETVSPGP